jgi:predicted ribosome quality control (RQC) complex YloA/Tae2 family protein
VKIIEKENTVYWVGRNSQDNWDTIKSSNQEWVWFHLEKFPSPHVVICKNLDDITDDEVNTACELVIEYSKYKFNNIGIVHCQIKNLILGTDIGSVTFKSYKKTTKIKYNLV